MLVPQCSCLSSPFRYNPETVKFFWVIAGFVALVVAPQLLGGGGSAVGIGIGIFLLFFAAPAIARYVIGAAIRDDQAPLREPL